MTPKVNEDLANIFKRLAIPSKTYWLNRDTNEIFGYCDGVEAVKQAVYKVLLTERYDWVIYSWNYGAELKGVFGRQMTYVYPEVKRRIEEALLQDDRIKKVRDFSFEKRRNTLLVTFIVESTEGVFESQVNVNV
ncbi:DUF2634 domain-containing protein [Anaerotignum sp. MB30-C6]|uniref:DUF2634 domain-containing protein n=1 Tax=Anaerotignum sp. MB30-C6 TaxID=3070814 RepID=UPI0027DC941E|nr:DUF2634 domain-containing protein [Anaerotignum sp. MB30-C6]WMI82035.1 DUF2634 domain-containing protein [Anaerotignum sp. MB30-C6]